MKATRRQVAELQNAITSRTFVPTAVRAWLTQLPEADWDAAVDELFDLDPFVPDAADLPSGCVPYIAAPVSALVRLVDSIGLASSDTFVDIGCGPGRAMMLVHLLTGARAAGIEVQAHLITLGSRVVQRFGLDHVRLSHADACDAALLPVGDVYFMYCPFGAERLSRVLGVLERRARERQIFVVGLQVNIPGCPWLEPVVSSADLDVFRSLPR